MTLRLPLAAGLLILLTACATGPKAPPPPPVESREIGVVGVMLHLPAQPIHTHYGTTVFNNFQKPYELQRDAAAEMRMAMVETLRAAGLEAIDLAAHLPEADSLRDLVGFDDTGWQLDPEAGAVAQALRTELGVQTVLNLEPYTERIEVLSFCTMYGCSYRNTDGWGLLTMSMMGLESYAAVPGARVRLYTLSPVSDLSLSGDLARYRVQPHRHVPLRNFPKADDFRDMRAAEWDPVIDGLVEWARGVAEAAVQRLQTP